MEVNVMCEKILTILRGVIRQYPEGPKDFAIIPSDENNININPVIEQDRHLGLESWCVKHVFKYAYETLLKSKSALINKKLSLPELDKLELLLTGALLINPDITTFWNMRREIMINEVGEYDAELIISRLVLTRKPKSFDAFSYRRWLIPQFFDMIINTLESDSTEELIIEELDLCTATASNARNNYHSWNHRQWCFQFIKRYPQHYINEYTFSEEFINENVSDYSGYHYRQFLIKSLQNIPYIITGGGLDTHSDRIKSDFMKYGIFDKLLDIKEDPKKFVIDLLGISSNSILSDKLYYFLNGIVLFLYELLHVIPTIAINFIEHECLWYHRRFVVHHLVTLCCEYRNELPILNRYSDFSKILYLSRTTPTSGNFLVKLMAYHSTGDEPELSFKRIPPQLKTSEFFRIFCAIEKKFLKDCYNTTTVDSFPLNNYGKRHELWLIYLMGIGEFLRHCL